MKYAVQFGAGNIGRGFMGQLFWEIGYRIVFVEADSKLVEDINTKGKYPLKLLDAYTKKDIDLEIDNIEALDAGDIEKTVGAIKKADVICTAVGDKALPEIAPVIARGLDERFSSGYGAIDIYLCENNILAATILRQEVMANSSKEMERTIGERTGFSGMVVSRMVPAASDRFGINDSLFAVADSYHNLYFDGQAIRAEPLPVQGMKAAKSFKAVFDRKLYTLNLTHAALGYLGFLKGYRYVHEPFEDGELAPLIDKAMQETSKALLKKYRGDLGPEEQREIIKDTRIRFGNPLLMDPITRVARDPLRKLGPDDRLVGSARLCMDQGIYPANIAKICGAALNYDYRDDQSASRMQKTIREKGIDEAVTLITGQETQTGFGKGIIDAYRYFKSRRKQWSSIGDSGR